MSRRLQSLLSLVVIFFSLLFLGREAWDNGGPLAAKSEISECHFLLKNSYVTPVDGVKLSEAGGIALLEFLEAPMRVQGWRERLQEFEEFEALAALEDLVRELSSGTNPPFTSQQALYLALDGMVKSLDDPYTIAMDPDTYAKFKESLESQPFGGVGMQLGRRDSHLIVFAVMPGTPASLADIRPGDILLSIEEQPVAELTVEQAEFLLQGEPGSDVFCRLKREGAPFSRTLTRVVLKTRSVRSRILPVPDGPRVGWITIEGFTDATGSELREELAKLNKEAADGLILDLRDNVGGYVNGALEVASAFLKSGLPVVSIKSREKELMKQTVGAEVEELPLLVIVNRRTASSAEIVAACLQDYQRAKLVGERTFGKGSIQSLYEFTSGGCLKYTTARYTSPKNRAIDGNGLLPDLVLEEVDIEILPYCKEQWTTKK